MDAGADFSKLFDTAAKKAAPPSKKLTGAGGAQSGAAKRPKKRPLGSEPATSRDLPDAGADGPRKKRKKKKKGKTHLTGESDAADAMPAAAAPSKKAGGPSAMMSKMESQLAGARFRYINELLYTRPSAEAQELFRQEPELYEVYHQGFRSQSARWPQNPVITIATWLKGKPPTWAVGDMGCGDAQLAQLVPQTVHSFDLIAVNERVTACDIAAVPLPDGSLDAVIFSLSLMGSNYVDFLREARRLLRPRGRLKVAEVRSRFESLERWLEQLRALGFDLVETDPSNTHFVLIEFRKAKVTPAAEAEVVPLKPCIYKRR